MGRMLPKPGLEYQFKKQTQHQMQQMPPNASSRCNNSFFFIHLNKYKNNNLSKRCGLSHSFIFFSMHFFKTQSFTLNCIWCRTFIVFVFWSKKTSRQLNFQIFLLVCFQYLFSVCLSKFAIFKCYWDIFNWKENVHIITFFVFCGLPVSGAMQ